jgi:CubicO group peptidase (beta-lactamase class C family)
MPRQRRWSHVRITLAIGAALLAGGFAKGEELPTTGETIAQFGSLDAWMQQFMLLKKVPGGSLAIAVNGEIKVARGYGYADRETLEPVEPDSLFRIASISKPITAVAVLKLIDAGKLKLDDKVIDLLKLSFPPSVSEKSNIAPDFDPWWNEVTVFHLLTHSGGWDRARSGDPMFMDHEITSAFGAGLPLTHQQLIGFQFLRGLDYRPGERFAYSNFGYCLLGRILEKATGEPYERHVQRQVFEPLGITSARMGGSLESERAEKEVKYYTINDYQDAAVVGPGIGQSKVPGQYGGWNQGLLDSHGGWIMSSADLVRFGAALDEVDEGKATRGRLLKPETARAMFTAHVPYRYGAEKKLPGYGFGWTITEVGSKPLVQHGGALPCTAAMLGRLDGNVWFAALFNLGKTSDDKWLQAGLDQELGRQVQAALIIVNSSK